MPVIAVVGMESEGMLTAPCTVRPLLALIRPADVIVEDVARDVPYTAPVKVDPANVA